MFNFKILEVYEKLLESQIYNVCVNHAAKIIYLYNGSSIKCFGENHKDVDISILNNPENKLEDSTRNQPLLSFEFNLNLDSLILVFGSTPLSSIYLLFLNLLEPTYSRLECVKSFEFQITSAAWSPDQEYLVLTSNKGEILILNDELEIVKKLSLITDEIGNNPHVALGWGSDMTQFKGSEGKAKGNTELPQDLKADIHKCQDLGQINQLPVLSWERENRFFACSSIETRQETCIRVVRIYDRSNAWSLHTTVQYTENMLPPVCWRADMSDLLTLATVHKGGSAYRINFYESNGLSHGSFDLVSPTFPQQSSRPASIVKLAYNHPKQPDDPIVLAILFAAVPGKKSPSQLELWTSKNYFWYRKVVLTRSFDTPKSNLPESTGFDGTDAIRDFIWDREDALSLHVITYNGSYANYRYTTHYDVHYSTPLNNGSDSVSNSSHLSEQGDLANLLVVNGAELLVTPVSSMIIPPPYYGYKMLFKLPIRALCYEVKGKNWGENGNEIGPDDHYCMLVLLINGTVVPFQLRPYNEMPSHDFEGTEKRVYLGLEVSAEAKTNVTKKNIMVYQQATTKYGHTNILELGIQEESSVTIISSLLNCSHFLLVDQSVLFVHSSPPDRFQIVGLKNLTFNSGPIIHSTTTPIVGFTTGFGFKSLFAQSGDGTVISADNGSVIAKFPRLCHEFSVITAGQSHFCVGLCKVSKRLYTTNNKGLSPQQQLMLEETGVDSYGILERGHRSADYLLFYTDCVKHVLRCKSIAMNPNSLAVESLEARGNIERKAGVVAILESSNSILLAAPRGNFEIVHSPVLIKARVRYLLTRTLNDRPPLFGEAFTLVKKHRLPYQIILYLAGLLDQPSGGLIEELVGGIGGPDGSRDADLSIFLANLKAPAETGDSERQLNPFYGAILNCIEHRGDKYLLSRLTTYASLDPPQIGAALSFLKGRPNNELVRGLKHLQYFADVDTLYDQALGTYDLDVCMMVAKQSQKDPKEYLEQLSSLRSQFTVSNGEITLEDPRYGRYRVDLARKVDFPLGLANLMASCGRWHKICQGGSHAILLKNEPPNLELSADLHDFCREILAKREVELWDFVVAKVGLKNAISYLTPGYRLPPHLKSGAGNCDVDLIYLRDLYWADLCSKYASSSTKISGTKAYYLLCAGAYAPTQAGLKSAVEAYAGLGQRLEVDCLRASLENFQDDPKQVVADKGESLKQILSECAKAMLAAGSHSQAAEMTLRDLREPDNAASIMLENLKCSIQSKPQATQIPLWSSTIWYIMAQRAPETSRRTTCPHDDSLKIYCQLMKNRLGLFSSQEGDQQINISLIQQLNALSSQYRDYCERLKRLLANKLIEPLPILLHDNDGEGDDLSFDDLSSVTSASTLASEVSSSMLHNPTDPSQTLSLTELLRARGGMIKPPPRSVIKSRAGPPSTIVSLKSSKSSKRDKKGQGTDQEATNQPDVHKIPHFVKRATLAYGSPFEHVALAKEMTSILALFLTSPKLSSNKGTLDLEMDDIQASFQLLTQATPCFGKLEEEGNAVEMCKALENLRKVYQTAYKNIVSEGFHRFVQPLLTMSQILDRNSFFAKDQRPKHCQAPPEFPSKTDLLNDILKIEPDETTFKNYEGEINFRAFEYVRSHILFVFISHFTGLQ